MITKLECYNAFMANLFGRWKSLLYITGDTHRDFNRLFRFCDRIRPSKNDAMIILGDAGFNYYGGWRDAFAKSSVSNLPKDGRSCPVYDPVELSARRTIAHQEEAFPDDPAIRHQIPNSTSAIFSTAAFPSRS